MTEQRQFKVKGEVNNNASNPEIKLDDEIVSMIALKGSQLISLRVEKWLVEGFRRWLKDYPGFNIQDGLRALMLSAVKGRFKGQLEAPSPSVSLKLSKPLPFDQMSDEVLRNWIADSAPGIPGYVEACQEVHRRKKEGEAKL